jgi:hypothetical protein
MAVRAPFPRITVKILAGERFHLKRSGARKVR